MNKPKRGRVRLASVTAQLLAFAVVVASGYPLLAQGRTLNSPPSVTSMGFGGSRRPGGVPPSVTSLGFGRVGTPGSRGNPGFFTSASPFSRNPHAPFSRPHRHPFYPIGSYAYPLYFDPGYVDQGYGYMNVPDSANMQPEDEEEYRGGPTIFDRRGAGQFPVPGSASVSEPVRESIQANSAPQEVAQQPPTILVFKDGHQSEIENYAIVGSNLFDLSGGRRHKIALSELNLNETAKVNDDRGVDFQLPANSASN